MVNLWHQLEKEKKDGSISYYAEIVIRRKGEILHREGRTFLKNKLAKIWAAKRELELLMWLH